MSYLVLACTGLDKPEGSVSREVALRLAEDAGFEILCPVSLNRTPARYKKALAEKQVIVVDGCATRCAAKLAVAAGATPAQKVIVSEVLKETGGSPCPRIFVSPARRSSLPAGSPVRSPRGRQPAPGKRPHRAPQAAQTCLRASVGSHPGGSRQV